MPSAGPCLDVARMQLAVREVIYDATNPRQYAKSQESVVEAHANAFRAISIWSPVGIW